MRKFLDVLDGSGKPPREQQIDYLTYLQESWDKYRVHALCAQPGFGKSFVARTLQRTLGDAVIVAPNNMLVDQYAGDYQDLNSLKGKDYYEDESDYKLSRVRAESMDNVFNPLSFYYFYLRRPELPRPSVVVIDEAHKLGDLLLLTIAKALPCEAYGIPEGLNDVQFLEWLDRIVPKLAKVDGSKSQRAKRLQSQFEQLHLMHEYMKKHLKHVKVGYEMKEDYRKRKQLHLVVQPIRFPSELMKTVFGDAKLLLMSGTLTDLHLVELFPLTKYDLRYYDSQAPMINRPIYYHPIPQQFRTDPERVAAEIIKIYLTRNQPNTLVHVSYSFAQQLTPYLRHLKPITHTPETKQRAIDEFKAKGGLLLGSGMAEGLDLPGDYCRCIIIPRLLFPNKGDQAVQKRLNLPNGNLRYVLDTMMTTIQQIGRGVRGPTDSCDTYILDCHFPNSVSRVRRYLRDDFVNSIHGLGGGE